MNKKRRFRLLKLLIIYVLALILGVVLAVFTKSKIYAAIFYLIIIIGLLIYIVREGCNWKVWFQKPHGNPVNVGTLLFGFLAGWTVVKTKNIKKQKATEKIKNKRGRLNEYPGIRRNKIFWCTNDS